MNYADILPPECIEAQRKWDHRQRLRRIHQAGATYAEMARREKCHPEWIRAQIAWATRNKDKPPMGVYLRERPEVDKRMGVRCRDMLKVALDKLIKQPKAVDRKRIGNITCTMYEDGSARLIQNDTIIDFNVAQSVDLALWLDRWLR